MKRASREHIEGDDNVFEMEHEGKMFTGWVEPRGDGVFDIAIVLGKFSVEKNCTMDDFKMRVQKAASELAKTNEDVLVKKEKKKEKPVKPGEKLPGGRKPKGKKVVLGGKSNPYMNIKKVS